MAAPEEKPVDADELDLNLRKKLALEAHRAERATAGRGRTTLAAYVMLVASCCTTGNIAFNFFEMHARRAEALAGLNHPNLARGDEQAAGLCCALVVFVPILTCLFMGSRHLLALGSRSVIVTSIVANVTITLLLGAGILFILMYARPELQATASATIGWNGLSCFLNLLAAFLTIRALMNADVAIAFQKRLESEQAVDAADPPSHLETSLEDSESEENAQPSDVGETSPDPGFVRARRKMRAAGWVMAFAGVLAGVGVTAGAFSGLSTDGFVITLIFTLPAIGLLFVGSRSLLILRFPKLIAASIASCIYLAVILCSGHAVYVPLLLDRAAPQPMDPQMFLVNIVAGIFCLAAASSATIAVGDLDLSD
jgi:hypothetical protein